MGYMRDDEFLKKFGKRLKELRISKGYTQEKLAFSIGIEISQISRIERGVSNPSISTIKAVAEQLSLSLPELFENI
ncbi:helix-turn-helix transcriptional regulator [bacterium]|nr:helix-turn-helix transcriptional regulator [bacterium]